MVTFSLGVEGVENVNLTQIIRKHTDYCTKMKEVFEAINLTQPCSAYQAF